MSPSVWDSALVTFFFSLLFVLFFRSLFLLYLLFQIENLNLLRKVFQASEFGWGRGRIGDKWNGPRETWERQQMSAITVSACDVCVCAGIHAKGVWCFLLISGKWIFFKVVSMSVYHCIEYGLSFVVVDAYFHFIIPLSPPLHFQWCIWPCICSLSTMKHYFSLIGHWTLRTRMSNCFISLVKLEVEGRFCGASTDDSLSVSIAFGLIVVSWLTRRLDCRRLCSGKSKHYHHK